MNPDRLDPGSHEHDHSAIPAPRPLDHAPAADLALDALDRIQSDAGSYAAENLRHFEAVEADAAIIRDALADRITADEARIALGRGDEVPRHEFDALIARLGKIAEAGR